MQDYKKLELWRISDGFVLKIYEMSNSFPKEETFNMVSQIRRSSLSIPLNIAEGCGRRGKKDFARFLKISLGSLNETE